MKYINEKFEKERALYGIKDSVVESCRFEGLEDGESPLKETNNVEVKNCYFDLRYPLWHMHNSVVSGSTFTINSRAPFWYSSNTKIINSKIDGVKFLRECDNIDIYNSEFNSTEFAWNIRKLKMENSKVVSEYPFFGSNDVELINVEMKGKYSFQYVNNLHIINSNLDTKDAFWHANNVLVENSVIKGEYLAWYSKNVKLVNCKVIGTQPFCYCDNLVMVNCEMINCDLAFENSTIDVEVISSIDSIKNPINGKIKAKEIKEIILDEFKKEGNVEIIK